MKKILRGVSLALSLMLCASTLCAGVYAETDEEKAARERLAKENSESITSAIVTGLANFSDKVGDIINVADNPYAIVNDISSLDTSQTSSWMSNLRGNVRLSDILVPSSHDCGSYSTAPTNLLNSIGVAAQTQDLSVYNQLKCGVRVLDLRTRMCHKKSVFNHGPVNGCETTEILADMLKFSEEHPTEIIAVSMVQCTSDSIKYILESDEMKKIIPKCFTKTHCKKTGFPLPRVAVNDIRKANANFVFVGNYDNDCFHSSSVFSNYYNEKTRTSDTATMIAEELRHLGMVSIYNLRNMSPVHTATTRDFLLNKASPMEKEYRYAQHRNSLLRESSVFQTKANIVSLDAIWFNREFIKELININKARGLFEK